VNLSLQGKVALVTGGSSGIGRATSMVFAEEGAKVVIADINVPGGYETVQMIKKTGGEATFIKTDVRLAAEVEAMVEQTVKTYGGLDCAFNNAGVIGAGGPITEAAEDDWDYVIDTNLKGVWLCLKYEIRYMAGNGGGSIVNTSSVAGYFGFDGAIPYGASKHGVLSLTKAMALTYGEKGIRVNAVCPANIHTPMADLVEAEIPGHTARQALKIPLGRIGKVEEVANTVVWLCSNAASYITGHSLTVDAGFTTGHYAKKNG
jgi:NAD(P)-dependent dehydrogenase (short-subunit alcohol dehydrogenase family)